MQSQCSLLFAKRDEEGSRASESYSGNIVLLIKYMGHIVESFIVICTQRLTFGRQTGLFNFNECFLIEGAIEGAKVNYSLWQEITVYLIRSIREVD